MTKGGSAFDEDHDNPNNGSRHAWYLIDGPSIDAGIICLPKSLAPKFQDFPTTPLPINMKAIVDKYLPIQTFDIISSWG